MCIQLSRRTFLAGAGAAALAVGRGAHAADRRPNILWIIVEDMSRNFGCYGETTIETPHVDQLAAEGTRFDNAYVTGPVCSPSRSALITGMYQTTIGAQHHRSGRGDVKIELPAHVRLIPALFREAGYFVTNGQGVEMSRPGKTDYNFTCDNELYDGADWRKRPAGRPFFAQVQLAGGKYGQGHFERRPDVPHPVDPKDVTLPPYYPDHPVIRADWAHYLDTVTHTDDEVGAVMSMLEAEGVADSTVVFFITDHGISHARGKQFLYEEGAHIPLIVWGRGRVPAGEVREDLALHIDLAASALHFAGIPIPAYLESRSLFGGEAAPREYIVCARDRCDETEERIRSVRKGTMKYIRNYFPKRPCLQPNRYKDDKDVMQVIRALDAEGAFNKVQQLVTAKQRPPEELYDLAVDPYEIHNLAGDPDHADALADLRDVLARWIRETGDQGQAREAMAQYDSDMAVYREQLVRYGSEKDVRTLDANIEQMKAWRAKDW